MGAKAEPLSAKGLAVELGTDARTVRKFLRAHYGNVGQGHRWNIEANKKQLASLKKAFDDWQRPKVVKADEAKTDDEADLEELEVELESLD